MKATLPDPAAAFAVLGDGLDALHEGLLVQDAAGRILYTNASAARLLGAPSKALAGSVADHPLARAATGTVVRLDGPDGERWIAVSRRALGRTGDEPAASISSFVDVTERQRAERALRAERDRAQRYLDVAGTMIVVIGADERVQLINRVGCDVLGYLEDELVGRNWFEHIVPLEERDAWRDAFHRLLAGEVAELEHLEAAVLTKAGDRRVVSWHTSPLRDDDGVVTGALSSGEDITDRRRAEHQITYLAYHDDLTGLPNRALLREHLELALARSRRHGDEVALLFLDLDDFKLVNDSLGHIAGDQLLCRIAARLQRVTRETDLLARQGGDEFLLLLADVPPGEGRRVAETVAQHITEALQDPFTIAGAEFHIGASIGISLYPRDAEDVDSLLMHADSAMYQAKASGEGGFKVYTGDGEDPLERLEMTTRLRRALERDEFVLHYQPIWALADGALVGVEALIRWNDPDRGEVPPGMFIPVAEDTGLIEPIGDWVVRELCRQARAWGEEGFRPQMSFNVSPRQLRRPDLAAGIRAHVDEHGLDPQQFTVEITESATLRDPERTEPILDLLHAAGMRLAIDDFGSGYSSLGRLREMPVQALKIDRMFLRELPGDREAAEIVTAILALSRALGMGIVAEGVETEEQRRFLAELGCPLAQGFHLGRPVPAADLLELMRRVGLTRNGHPRP